MALWRRKDFDDLEKEVCNLFSGYRNGKDQLNLLNPHFDVKEKDDHFLVHAETPGVKKEDIHVDFRDGSLIVKGEKKQEKEKNDQYHIYERKYGSFERRIKFPTSAKAEEVKATLTDGVLEIYIPKHEGENQQSRVTVN